MLWGMLINFHEPSAYYLLQLFFSLLQINNWKYFAIFLNWNFRNAAVLTSSLDSWAYGCIKRAFDCHDNWVTICWNISPSSIKAKFILKTFLPIWSAILKFLDSDINLLLSITFIFPILLWCYENYLRPRAINWHFLNLRCVSHFECYLHQPILKLLCV